MIAPLKRSFRTWTAALVALALLFAGAQGSTAASAPTIINGLTTSWTPGANLPVDHPQIGRPGLVVLPNGTAVGFWLAQKDWRSIDSIYAVTYSPQGEMSQPVSLATTTPRDSTAIWNAQLTPDGRVALTYSEVSVSDDNAWVTSTVYITYSSDGLNWSTPVVALPTLTRDAAACNWTCYYASISTYFDATGRVAVAAVVPYYQFSKLYVSYSDDGQTFEQPTLLSDGGVYCGVANCLQFEPSGNQLLLIFSSGEDFQHETLYYATHSLTTGTNWSDVHAISPHNLAATHAFGNLQLVDIGQGKIFAYWGEMATTPCVLNVPCVNYYLLSSTWDPTANAWSQPVTSYTSYQQGGPFIYIHNADGSDKRVIWLTGQSLNSQSIDSMDISGETLTNHRTLTSVPATLLSLRYAYFEPDGTIATFFEQGIGPIALAELTIRPSAPAVLTPAISTTDRNSEWVNAALRPDGTAVVFSWWQGNVGGTSYQFASRGLYDINYTDPNQPVTPPVVDPPPAPQTATPPVAHGYPTVVGTPKTGAKLTIRNVTFTSNFGIGLNEYQWYRCAKQVKSVGVKKPSVCTAIKGSIGATYKVTKADKSKYLLVSVSNSNNGGASTVYSKSTVASK